MTPTNLIRQLNQQQNRMLNLCKQAKNSYRKQYHPDLSPIGWHIGHCIYTENYWVREKLLELEAAREKSGTLFIPEHSDKNTRGVRLPEHEKLCHWLETSQKENISLLEKKDKHNELLMKNNFLLHFLIQHYAQHYETIQMAFAQAELQECNGNNVSWSLSSRKLNTTCNNLPHDEYVIGAIGQFLPYDNEYPGHQREIKSVKIAQNPVSNSEYLRFMEENGYEERQFWSDEGWQWRSENNVIAPEYWKPGNNNCWFGVDANGAYRLSETGPVTGISYYEATAFCNWAGARLPCEHEWEAADSLNLLNGKGKVWEWCQNAFYPYDGFIAFPYDGYSTPYFDGKHYTLRGGSSHTQTVIKRPSFRNYYQPDKRYIFAGLRLAFE